MSYALGDWSDATPDNMRTWPEDKLLFAMRENRGGVYDGWARAELTRRQNEQLGDLIGRLTQATDTVAGGVEGLKHEVSVLTSSSDRLETLTKKLNCLTIILVVLTICAVIVPIGIEIYHAKYEDKKPTPPIVVVASPTTEPQTSPPSTTSKLPQPNE
jgi:hypothetical protein